jgi:hypothetical protein
MLGQCKSEGIQPNVESLLSKVRMKIDAMSDDESLVGLDRQQLRALEQVLCTTIAEQVNPAEV